MAVKRIPPSEAHKLVGEGWQYVDVRSVLEFQQGHPAGAYNAPLMHMGSGGMSPNGEFLDVMAAAFPKDARLVIGCKTGGRSQRAAMMLEAAGFVNLVEMRGGWSGESDQMGRVVEKGWASLGLPSSTQPEPGRAWDDLRKNKR